jgi:hypothetical protein
VAVAIAADGSLDEDDDRLAVVVPGTIGLLLSLISFWLTFFSLNLFGLEISARRFDLSGRFEPPDLAIEDLILGAGGGPPDKFKSGGGCGGPPPLLIIGGGGGGGGGGPGIFIIITICFYLIILESSGTSMFKNKHLKIKLHNKFVMKDFN